MNIHLDAKGGYIAATRSVGRIGRGITDRVYRPPPGLLEDPRTIYLGRHAAKLADRLELWTQTLTHETFHLVLEELDLGRWSGVPFDKVDLKFGISKDYVA